MHALRLSLAAAALTTVSAFAIASDAQAAQIYGRDKMSAVDRIEHSPTTVDKDLVGISGRQGRLPTDAMPSAQQEGGSADVADIASEPGRA